MVSILGEQLLPAREVVWVRGLAPGDVVHAATEVAESGAAVVLAGLLLITGVDQSTVQFLERRSLASTRGLAVEHLLDGAA